MYSRFTSLLFREARFPRSLLLGLFGVTAASQAHGLSMPQRLFGTGSFHCASRPSATSATPYLAQIGAAPLRFAPPPPEPVERPAPPETKPAATPASVTPEPATTTTSIPPPAAHIDATPSGPSPVRILPDDTPHEVRAEDVLPYFQLPRQGDRSAASGLNLPFTPAAPSTLPPSSATYQLK